MEVLEVGLPADWDFPILKLLSGKLQGIEKLSKSNWKFTAYSYGEDWDICARIGCKVLGSFFMTCLIWANAGLFIKVLNKFYIFPSSIAYPYYGT